MSTSTKPFQINNPDRCMYYNFNTNNILPNQYSNNIPQNQYVTTSNQHSDTNNIPQNQYVTKSNQNSDTNNTDQQKSDIQIYQFNFTITVPTFSGICSIFKPITSIIKNIYNNNKFKQLLNMYASLSKIVLIMSIGSLLFPKGRVYYLDQFINKTLKYSDQIIYATLFSPCVLFRVIYCFIKN